MIFADIIIDISVKSLDKTFQYIVPPCLEDEVKTGSLVTVPFGNGNRQLKGSAAVGKMEEAKVTEIDLTEAELEEITLTPEQEEELKKKLLFAINQDTETGRWKSAP